MKRYSAKLLFQFRIEGARGKSIKRTCEERICHFSAQTGKRALALANKLGKTGWTEYLNKDGKRVYFEFVGVMDMIRLGTECDQYEVWYDIRERLRPLERRRTLIPSDGELLDRIR